MTAMERIGNPLVALGAGLLFGLGLAVSGMVDPLKVLSFLDVAAIRTGTWDGTLVFVLGGAVAVTVLGYGWALQRSKPFFHETFVVPTAKDIDLRLVGGAAAFGLGWGLVGLCPGTALAALVWPMAEPALFAAAMVAGLWLGERFAHHRIPHRN
jgi:uncharacterized membrane protein YedE/YeeE